MMESYFKLRTEEINHLVQTFDSQGRQEIRIGEILEEVKEMVTNVKRKIEIMNFLTSVN